jgi:hypothetical protein
VVVGAGSVKSEIWHKDLGSFAAKYEQTDYGTALAKFQRLLGKWAAHSYSAEEFGRAILRIFETPNPRARYAIVPNRLFNWSIPRRLPDRLGDYVLGRAFKLLRF